MEEVSNGSNSEELPLSGRLWIPLSIGSIEFDIPNEVQCTNESESPFHNTALDSGWWPAFPTIRYAEISYDLSSKLGNGNSGTTVFQGTFGTRKVAVKRIFLNLLDSKNKSVLELKLMQDSDDHPNVVKFYKAEFLTDYVLIAMELCNCTLTEYIEKKPRANIIVESQIGKLQDSDILEQITEGVKHLHGIQIVHRDIKPDNILLKLVGANTLLVKISDFGISRRIPHGQTSLTTVGGAGTVGWMAPEILVEGEVNKFSFKSDTFSLGCVYYYVLAKGKHPFDSGPYTILQNVHNGINVIQEDHLDVMYRGNIPLIKSMITKDKNSRPEVKFLLSHHLFWDAQKLLNFIHFISNVKGEEKHGCKEKAEDYFKHSTGGLYLAERAGWRREICELVKKAFFEHQERKNKIYYKGDSVMKLVRLIRNMANHLHEKSDEVRETVGDIPDGLLKYFLSKFPSLLNDVWQGFQSMKRSREFQQYYCSEYDFY